MASSSSDTGSSLGLSPQPFDLPQFESLDLRVQYQSPRCGGDFFDAVSLHSRLLFLLTDIAGRRPETHAIAAEVQKTFRSRAQELFADSGANESEGIALFARDVNRSLIEAVDGVRFAPAFLGCYNTTLNILTYHYAGHLLAFFYDGEKTRALEACGIPLGLFTHSTYEPAVLAFGPNAKLLLVTKGGGEDRQAASRSDDERIGMLLENAALNTGSLCDAVLQETAGAEKRSRRRIGSLVRSRSQKDCDDRTAVALVRR
jgi:serine phosphatase RsbU (regulator of sigma subunit)